MKHLFAKISAKICRGGNEFSNPDDYQALEEEMNEFIDAIEESDNIDEIAERANANDTMAQTFKNVSSTIVEYMRKNCGCVDIL